MSEKRREDPRDTPLERCVVENATMTGIARGDRKLYLALYPGHDANVTVVDEAGRCCSPRASRASCATRMTPGFPDSRSTMSRATSDALRARGHGADARKKKLLRDAHFLWDSWRRGLAVPSPGVILKGYLNKLRSGRLVERGASDNASRWLVERPLCDVSHHDAHAASAYYAAGHSPAICMTLDGQGDDRYSSGFYCGDGPSLTPTRMFYLNEVSVGYSYMLTTAMLGLHGVVMRGRSPGLPPGTIETRAAMRSCSGFLPNAGSRSPRAVTSPTPSTSSITLTVKRSCARFGARASERGAIGNSRARCSATWSRRFCGSSSPRSKTQPLPISRWAGVSSVMCA